MVPEGLANELMDKVRRATTMEELVEVLKSVESLMSGGPGMDHGTDHYE